MDNICIKTSKFKQFEQAAKLSAVQVIEVDEYIKLAMYVEKYLTDPSDILFSQLQEQLHICTSHFPCFHQSRQSLVTILLQLGLIKQDSHNQPSTNNSMIKDIHTPNKETSSPTPSNPQDTTTKQPSNVIDIFTKKPINPSNND